MKDYAGHSNEELCVLAKAGDEAALEELIQKNRPFLISMASKVSGGKNVRGITRDELINEGAVGIYEAVKGFDPGKGYAFLTFAGRVVRNKMLDLINVFSNKHQGISLEQIREDSENREWTEHPDLRVTVEDAVVRKIFLEEVRECFLKLTPRQQQILAYKFGIDLSAHPLKSTGRNLSDEKVAEYFGSKVSLIRKSQKEAHKTIEQELFPDGEIWVCEL